MLTCFNLGSKGWHSGQSARLPSVGPGFKSRRRRHMWVEFVVGSLPCSERFFSGYSGFPSPQKPAFPNSNSTRNQVDEEPLCGCATSKSLFIYLFIYIYLFICLGFNYGEKVAEKLGFETDRWRVNPTDQLLSAFSERKDSTISKLIEASQEAGLPRLASELEKRFLQGS